ncbi:MAG TPA: cytochrome c nitrite reductase small subunit [Polyangiaceae bacterium]|jgi:cytochrome c nitrite reductase small subunit|nr:cytochrome c nitrite reductase small subunit [Polyangiaceae bacterium]
MAEPSSSRKEKGLKSRVARRPHWETLLIVAISVTAGVAVGLGGFTFVYAKGGSYLQNDPAACVNCHIMSEQYTAWYKSSHRSVAVCNDCHAPHDFLGKYMTKASNGFWHSFGFTTGRFPDPIRIKPANLEITEKACRGCHGAVVHAIGAEQSGTDGLSCVRCHDSVGHMH